MKNEIRLSDAKVGEEYEVVKIEGSGFVKRRIMDMGLIPGERIKVIRIAPLGDPIDILVKGASISIRKREASFVIVRRVGV